MNNLALVFKNNSEPNNLKYEAVVRVSENAQCAGYFYSEHSMGDLREKLRRFKNLQITNGPPSDYQIQQEKLNVIFRKMGLENLPALSLAPLDKSEL